MKITKIVLLASAFTSSIALAALPLKVPSGQGSVSFLAVGRPSMLKIHGEAKGPVTDLKLENNQLRGTVEIEIEKFQTGITLRDQHMKEKYLQAKEFPRARLSITEAAVDGDFTKSLNLTGEKPFRGKLSLHGKEQDVVGTFQVKEGLVQAKFPISLQDYSIEVPKYLGITVANTVDVSAEFPLLKE